MMTVHLLLTALFNKGAGGLQLQSHAQALHETRRDKVLSTYGQNRRDACSLIAMLDPRGRVHILSAYVQCKLATFPGTA